MSESITVRAPAPMGTRVRCLRDDRFQREVKVAPFEVRIETKRRGRLPNRWGTCRRAAGRSPSPSAWSDQNSFRRWPSLSIATTGECHVPLHEIRPRQGIRPARKKLNTQRRNRRSKRLHQEGFRKPRFQRRAPRTAIPGRTGQDDESALGVIVEFVPNPTLSEKQRLFSRLWKRENRWPKLNRVRDDAALAQPGSASRDWRSDHFKVVPGVTRPNSFVRTFRARLAIEYAVI